MCLENQDLPPQHNFFFRGGDHHLGKLDTSTYLLLLALAVYACIYCLKCLVEAVQPPQRAGAGTSWRPNSLFTREELTAMTRTELGYITYKLGIDLPDDMSKYDLVVCILTFQASLTRPAEQTSVPVAATTIFTKRELKAMPTSALEELAFTKGIDDVLSLPRWELEDLILAMQLSVQTAPPEPPPRNAHIMQSTASSMRPTAPPIPQDNHVDEVSSRPSALPKPPPAGRPEGDGGNTSTAVVGLLDCAVCMERMGGNALLAMAVLPCGHPACFNCLKKVVEGAKASHRSPKCPTCRKSYQEEQIRKVYL